MGEARTLQLEINGTTQVTTAITLAGLLNELGFSGAQVATAVDGHFVPASAREARVLTGGEKIEIVSPRQGG